MRISIIIPTYNEEDNIVGLVRHLQKYGGPRLAEIIVADGGSTDLTVQTAQQLGITVIVSSGKGRAIQMNLGAQHATGDILYFVHADSLPPISFVDDIAAALYTGHEVGCFRFRFQSDKFMLKINSYFTRFDRIMCRGGDQTLYMTRDLFLKLGGYRGSFVIMEDYDLIARSKKIAEFRIIPKDVLVSARKYDDNGYVKVNLANFTVFMLYFLGFPQPFLLRVYKKMILHPKL
jgi:rSAM/selenodomain-associated transferase 2